MQQPALERTAAELEIRNILARLAQLADSGDTDEYVSLLTDDVVWAMPANPAIGLAGSERRGRDEIALGQRERMDSGHQGPGSNTTHTISTISIRFENDDVAISQSSFVYWADTATAPVVRSMGRYADTFRRIDGRWMLARRVITFG
jgi:uncharacterized protein (TIGR02246 family)